MQKYTLPTRNKFGCMFKLRRPTLLPEILNLEKGNIFAAVVLMLPRCIWTQTVIGAVYNKLVIAPVSMGKIPERIYG